MADKELGAVHRPNSYNTNSVINNWGFRNADNISQQKYKGTRRIYCSGGSTTFCYNLSTNESWPSLLQHKLRQIAGHEHDEALNAGEICFAVSHEFALAKRLIPVLKPDVAILYSLGTNEASAAEILTRKEGLDLDILLREKRWGIIPKKLDQARFLKRHSMLVRLYDYLIKSIIEKRLAIKFEHSSILGRYKYPHKWIVENFENTLRAYIAFLRSNGCKVIIVRYGNNGAEGEYFNNYVRKLRDRAVSIGKDEGAIICDLASIVERHPRRKQLYINTGLHVTREGAELSADLLAKEVLKI